MMVTDEYCNFRSKATERYNQMSRVILRQRQIEKELRMVKGASPYMSTLMSTLTVGNTKLYNTIADKFSSYNTPTASGLSTPQRSAH